MSLKVTIAPRINQEIAQSYTSWGFFLKFQILLLPENYDSQFSMFFVRVGPLVFGQKNYQLPQQYLHLMVQV